MANRKNSEFQSLNKVKFKSGHPRVGSDIVIGTRKPQEKSHAPKKTRARSKAKSAR
jgi:hypothetical protein